MDRKFLTPLAALAALTGAGVDGAAANVPTNSTTGSTDSIATDQFRDAAGKTLVTYQRGDDLFAVYLHRVDGVLVAGHSSHSSHASHGSHGSHSSHYSGR